ncbi:MAG: iron-containing alcohol dehydrogenase [Thiohalomonadales bacterium]
MDIKDSKLLVGNWNYPTTIKFGARRSFELGASCVELNIKKPLLVTDHGLADNIFIQELQQSIIDSGITTEVFSKVKSNPTGFNISSGVEIYKTGNFDGVIAVGGGSALDAGKAIALMSGQTKSLWDFEDLDDNWKTVNPDGIAPVIAVPTTAGTGSEVGRAAVIVDEEAHAKKIIFHPDMMPKIVIADPGLTVGLPAKLTAATGIDAFVHNLEAYCSPSYHPIADGIAIEGMRLIKQWLPLAFNQGSDIVARSHMLIASTMGAAAFQKGLGAVHALAHPLGALYDKHHGLLNAILLPYVLVANKTVIKKKLSHVCQCLDLRDYSFDGFLQWVLEFRSVLRIPHDLQSIDITADKNALIGKLACADAAAAGNPIPFTAEQYSEIFINAVTGKI